MAPLFPTHSADVHAAHLAGDDPERYRAQQVAKEESENHHRSCRAWLYPSGARLLRGGARRFSGTSARLFSGGAFAFTLGVFGRRGFGGRWRLGPAFERFSGLLSFGGRRSGVLNTRGPAVHGFGSRLAFLFAFVAIGGNAFHGGAPGGCAAWAFRIRRLPNRFCATQFSAARPGMGTARGCGFPDNAGKRNAIIPDGC